MCDFTRVPFALVSVPLYTNTNIAPDVLSVKLMISNPVPLKVNCAVGQTTPVVAMSLVTFTLRALPMENMVHLS